MSVWLTKAFQSGLLLFAATAVCVADDTDAAALRYAQVLSFNCFTCHGTDGERPGTMKSLNTLSADEIRSKLQAYKRDEDDPTIMNRIAKGYSDEEISIIADYIAGLKQDE